MGNLRQGNLCSGDFLVAAGARERQKWAAKSVLKVIRWNKTISFITHFFVLLKRPALNFTAMHHR